MGGASGYIISCPATASQIYSLQRRRAFFADAEICRWSASAAELGTLAATSLQTRSSPGGYPVRSKKALLEEQISAQHCCKCRTGIPCTLMTLMLSVCHAWGNSTLTLCSAGLNPRCVTMGNDSGKTRLYSPIRSKTTALPRCARHNNAQRGLPIPPRRGDESAGKRSHRNRSSSPERVRLLQPLLPRP